MMEDEKFERDDPPREQQEPLKPMRKPKPPRAPKEKLPLGVSVFLWILSLTSVAMTAMFAIVLVSSISPFSLDEVAEAIRGEVQEYEQDEFPLEEELPQQEDGEIQAPPEKPNIPVEPNLEGVLVNQAPDTPELSASEVYQKVVRSTVTVKASMYLEETGQSTEPSTGTGIIATSDGYIITNSHVVFNSRSADVKIITYDGQEYDAIVIGVDKTTDLGVLKTNDHNFTPAEFGDADELEIGQWVLAIGNPGGAQFSSSLTRGIVSGLNRSVGRYSENGMAYIQTDAAINPGNSGGPLVNMHGQVVAINSSKIASTDYEGMGFAIPITNAQLILNELLSGGYVKGRTRLGIRGKDVSAQESYFQGLPQGFQIESVDDETSFSGTDVRVGDIIVAVDGQEVSGVDAIGNVLLSFGPGESVEVTIFRPNALGSSTGTRFNVTIVLMEDKGETSG